MSSIASLLAPLFALNIHTLAVEVYMFTQRIPVYQKLGVPTKNDLTKADIDKQVPPPVRWAGDNFNNLMEQPTNFYAVVLGLTALHYMAGAGATLGDGKLWRGTGTMAGEKVVTGLAVDAALAWGYVALRVLHSFVHIKGNNVVKRFQIYCVSGVVLATLTGRGALMVWRGV